MTVSEYRLLKAIRDNDGAVYAREVVDDDYQDARLLVERGYLTRVGALDVARYEITDAGRVALSDYEEARQKEIQRRADKQAQEERDRLQAEANSSKDRWFNLYSAIIGAVVGSFLTFLLDHFSDFLALIKRILGF